MIYRARQLITYALLSLFLTSSLAHIFSDRSDGCESENLISELVPNFEISSQSSKIFKTAQSTHSESTPNHSQSNPCGDGRCHFGHCSHMIEVRSQSTQSTPVFSRTLANYRGRQINRPGSQIYRPPIS